MNLTDLHIADMPVQTKAVFDCHEKVISLQILAGHTLKEHVSKVPAFLVCIEGEADYGEETGRNQVLLPGSFVQIEAHVKHWIDAKQTTNLLLIK
jgi:quercetin dioxygenase-like cupin family protein